MSAHNKSRLCAAGPLLCYVTDRNSLGRGKQSISVDLLLQKIDEIVSAGVDWIQIREKDLPAKELSHVVRESLRIAAKHCAGANPTRILVNNRLDIALAEDAWGVHLAGNSLPVAEVKKLVEKLRLATSNRRDFLVGVSCHSRLEGASAEVSGADYIFFGPVFVTPAKAAFGAPQGVDRLAEVCRALTIPVIAIGGITPENAKSCLTAGAAGLAAIRLFQDVADPAAAVRALHQLPSMGPSV